MVSKHNPMNAIPILRINPAPARFRFESSHDGFFDSNQIFLTFSLTSKRRCTALAYRLFIVTAMTIAVFRTAVPRLSQLAIGPNAGLRERTPEQTLIRTRDRRIGLRPDVLALGVQVRT